MPGRAGPAGRRPRRAALQGPAGSGPGAKRGHGSDRRPVMRPSRGSTTQSPSRNPPSRSRASMTIRPWRSPLMTHDHSRASACRGRPGGRPDPRCRWTAGPCRDRCRTTRACSGVKPRGCCMRGRHDQRLRRAQARGELEELERLGKARAGLEARGKIEGDHRAEAVHLAPGERVAGIRRQSRIPAPCETAGWGDEELRHARGIPALAVPAHEVGLEAPQDQDTRRADRASARGG